MFISQRSSMAQVHSYTTYVHLTISDYGVRKGIAMYKVYDIQSLYYLLIMSFFRSQVWLTDSSREEWVRGWQAGRDWAKEEVIE